VNGSVAREDADKSVHQEPAGIPRRWRVILGLLRRLPQGALSRAWGRLAEVRWPRGIQGLVNASFARIVGADLEEAESPPSAYASLSAFFVRRLRPGARRWPEHGDTPGSPVDGVLGEYGTLDRGIALQAKGFAYRVEDLLGDVGWAERFRSGCFLTIYLSPRHYHRIHSPLDATVRRAVAVPGRLLPVNLPAVRSIPDLFPRNERLVALMEAHGVPVAVVAIGAYNVGRISAAFDPGWNGAEGRGVTNRASRREPEIRTYDPAIPVRRGAELMAFHLGSTVVLMIGSGGSALPDFEPGLREGMEVRLGAPLLASPLDPALSD
jgi:phosphatidylserine decarboxylase